MEENRAETKQFWNGRPEIKQVVVQWPQCPSVKRVLYVSRKIMAINAAARAGANIICIWPHTRSAEKGE